MSEVYERYGELPRLRDSQRAGQQLLPRRVYRFRVLGMGVAGLPIALVLRENGAAPWSFALLVFTCLLWPHLAYLLARRSPQPFQTELRSLMLDSLIAGLWVPLMHFNLLPSVLLLTVATADKINTGVRALWLRSLPGMALGVLFGGMLTHFVTRYETSLVVMLACLPLLVIHTLAVSLGSYQLVRMVQGRNRRLDELSRLDGLTGLANRRHWQDEAGRLLQAWHADGKPATLMLVDVDMFKAINDRHGHAVGDDVLRRLAELIHRHIGPDAHAGRLGGDEFAIVMPGPLHAAEVVAERLRRSVETLGLSHVPELRCSISLGLAQASEAGRSLREWSEVADRALYRAKHAGRNRMASGTEPQTEPA